MFEYIKVYINKLKELVIPSIADIVAIRGIAYDYYNKEIIITLHNYNYVVLKESLLESLDELDEWSILNVIGTLEEQIVGLEDMYGRQDRV